MENTYPLIACEHPRVIVNKYGESILVPCGHCRACVASKSSAYVQEIKLESFFHKYCLFITLTYDNFHIPRIATKELYSNYHQLFAKRGRVTAEVPYDEVIYNTDDLNLLKDKFNIQGDIPTLYKKDLQNFMKNIRRKLNYRFDGKEEKLRYYAIGEYGPVHYRPHYHILLWFEDSSTYETLLQIIPKTWKNGSVDCQRSFGKSANYVAGYLNSFNSLPRILQSSSSKPFCCHSRYLGQAAIEDRGFEIYTDVNRNSLSVSFNDGGKLKDSFTWSSLKTRYFPKCLSYSQLDWQGRYDAYTVWLKARDVIGGENLGETTRLIVDALIDMHKKYGSIKEPSLNYIHLTYNYDDFFKYFACVATDGKYHILNTLKLGEYDNFTIQLRKQVEGRVYRALRSSKVFIEKICNNNLNLITRRIKDIQKYYDDTALGQLSKFYTHMELHPECIKYMYNDTFDSEKLKKEYFYKLFVKKNDEYYESHIKHKKLNDLNNIFNNI